MFSFQLCAEGPDGEIYCNLCYAYKHGHKAKPNLHDADVTVIQGEEGESNVCPRSVFVSHKIMFQENFLSSQEFFFFLAYQLKSRYILVTIQICTLQKN
jgi:hypothetical protein